MDDLAALVWGRTFEEVHLRMEQLMKKTGGVIEWADLHNCSFGTDKFKLIDATRRREKGQGGRSTKPRGPGVSLGSHTIKSEVTARFLGVLVDEELRWKQQHALMVRHGQTWVTQFRRVAKIAEGMTAQHIRQLYKSKAVPRMLYGACVMLATQTRPRKDGKLVKSSIVSKLTSIQRKAALIITGALSTTATDLLDLHAGLLPLPLEIKRHRHRDAARLCTLPDTHPLSQQLQRAAKHPRMTRHISLLHDLLHGFGLKPSQLETRKPVRFNAQWDPGLETYIWGDEDTAVEACDTDDADLQFFTDGSGYKGGIGASAVMYWDGEEIDAIRYRLGSNLHHEVYEGECVGLILALHLL
ncbi:hypothetical protein K435DRAFT_669085, partial [Dendrothele bispora CBS 962.96]